MDREVLLRKMYLGCAASVIVAMMKLRRKKQIFRGNVRSRRIWVKPIYLRRKEQGFSENLIAELRLSDPLLFFNFTRMTPTSFQTLLNLCGKELTKTSPREPIAPATRLIVTLRYLTTGDSYPSLGYSFRIHPSTICNIIRETCTILWETLSPIYLKKLTESDWLNIAEDFQRLWQLPNCLGSIDGKHIRIRAPSNSGSRFFNYKKYFSIILLAVCDAQYNFIYVDIGAYGAQSDGGVLRNSNFGKKLLNYELNIPKSKRLPSTNENIPLYFVGDERGDEAFPLHLNLLRPYSHKRNNNMPEDELIFNYRLSRARRTIENTLGIMVARFRIFHREINASPDTVDAIVKATTCLHNFIKLQNAGRNFYCERNYVDREENGQMIPGEFRRDLPEQDVLDNVLIRFGNRNAPKAAWNFRDFMKNYLNGPGSAMCPWQYEHIQRTI